MEPTDAPVPPPGPTNPHGVDGGLSDAHPRVARPPLAEPPPGLSLEQQLEASASRYAALFNAAPLGIALSHQGTYLHANPAFLKLFGHEQESEILGQSLLDHIEAGQRNLLRARNQERERTGFGPLTYETVGLHKDGTPFPMQLHVTSLPLEQGTGTLAFISDISERKQFEQRLQDREETFRSYVEQSIDVIFTLDAQGVFTFVSPAWERHFGIPASAVMGQSFVPFVHPEDVQPCTEYLLRVLATDQVETSPPYRVRHANETWRWFIANGASMPLPGGGKQFIGVGHDITESRAAEAALRDSEEQMRVIFETSEAGIILVSPQGDIRFANRRMGELFGMSPQALLGTPYPEHLHPSEKQTGDDLMHRLIEGQIQSVSVERRYLRGDGTDFWGHLSGRRLEHPDGSLRALVGVITDISDRKRMEQERLVLEQQQQQIQKMESLGSLAGGVAHDINNVLGAILGLASAQIENLPKESATHQAFDTIIKAAQRGGATVKSLLSLARQNPSERRELDVNGILREQIRLLEHTTLAKVRLVLDLAPDLRPLQGDVSLLAHAFMNLCVNAAEAMAEEGTLTLGTRNLGEGEIEVRVVDGGCGMCREVLDKAMDPFFTTKAQGKGTGLGLSLVYSAVKAHGGHMEIHSEPGRGTTVILRFPASVPAPRAVDLPARPQSQHQPPRRPLTVLLVDDDELVQSSTQMVLKALGHEATPAFTGEAALAALEAGLQPDVVILDMNMPGLGGAGTLPRLRTLNPTVPILLATGRADQSALDLVAAHPHVTLLAKPFSLGDLRKQLEGLGH